MLFTSFLFSLIPGSAGDFCRLMMFKIDFTTCLLF